ncbi:hypothetical protein [Mobilicoccus caccae]|uniref:Lytic transglycosylase domain-containing protein n=1 Tax=Mobilicoccus caccae TaxID=1859295 RepID=A0ABQ6IV95_9MICO|nr:hypothetical protein [Mobilicoccus caccae]GMA40657.1 hypothetical protein GCM10025883_27020 [Mobilicoccus caccae]
MLPASAQAAPGDGQVAAPSAAHRALSAPVAGVHLGSLTAAAGQPLSGLTLNVFATAPVVAQKAQAAQRAAEKRAVEKRAAEKKAAAKKKAAEKKAAAKKKAAAARADSGARASRSSARGGSPRDIARAMVADRGWSSEQFGCLDRLWTKESEWLTRATNPSSGAYGIPQSLPGSKMASAGADWRTNPATQIRWGLGYIADRYGSPCKAWSHSKANNWY